MKKLFIGEYLRMFQFGNGFSDHELASRSGIDEERIRYILSKPEKMTFNELVRLADVFDLKIEFNLERC